VTINDDEKAIMSRIISVQFIDAGGYFLKRFEVTYGTICCNGSCEATDQFDCKHKECYRAAKLRLLMKLLSKITLLLMDTDHGLL